jgi:hypothetical protein
MAFPSEALGQTGMTLRDWFAGMILSGILAGREQEYGIEDHEDIAEYAYKMADAMLKERNK